MIWVTLYRNHNMCFILPHRKSRQISIHVNVSKFFQLSSELFRQYPVKSIRKVPQCIDNRFLKKCQILESIANKINKRNFIWPTFFSAADNPWLRFGACAICGFLAFFGGRGTKGLELSSLANNSRSVFNGVFAIISRVWFSAKYRPGQPK